MEREYKVTTGGRITIPAGLRKKHGIKTPVKILIEELKDGIKIYPLNKKTKKRFHLT
ncbi:MAG: AbrB/MazE/SpoVT family DNA-binding domain-containing protein [Melioribacteraceae bacterium]